MYNANIDKDVLLKVENFSLKFEPPDTYAHSLRDKFVELCKDPISFLFNTRDQLQILKDISFNVHKGDIIGLLGTNGVGKTSLCRYLSGIVRSKGVECSGDVRAIFDTNISFYPNLSGYENTVILTELLYANYSKEERKKILHDAIEFSELNEFLPMPINRYSKGMKARLYLSLVTARPADLIILDEIFGATDIFFAEKLSARIHSLISESGAAVVVSHNFDDIKSYCNKVIILSDKVIHFNGSVDEGIEVYKNLR
jgi:ABC-type polysaccharide/polyol phosphate transport system ATPase subunit